MVSCLVAGPVQAQAARDYISIVGSSTVYPFSTVVAEQFGKTSKFKTPKVESTGSGGGIKLFCGGVGVQHPDIVNSSRPIKPAELDTCAANGVKDIVEVKIGYDGIVMAESKASPGLPLTLRDVYLALAKQVPNPNGAESLVPNPYKTWKDVNPKLPAETIEVLGPPPTSGTRDAFVELAMEGGCKTFPWIKAIKDKDENRFKQVCYTIREDGRFVEAGENDNLIVQKLKANKNAVGIFGYSFLEENTDSVKGSIVDGQAPTFENIASGKYPISRPLFFYVKKAHIGAIPGIKEYVAEFTSRKAMGDEGYLADRGLVPLPAAEYQAVAKKVAAMEVMRPAR
ncbi:MAG: PstS family phosphate ABC transporter substrate-binding protein [Gammaproteobacteria bacterium]|nr:PstS family phosphate ABC transporter substrate-binding protein [Gammaproteobacteria bacterium]